MADFDVAAGDTLRVKLIEASDSVTVIPFLQSAIHGINQYLWDQLQNQVNWELIRGMVPIFPAQQQPEPTESEQPFIVYNWTVSTPWVTFELQTEQAAYIIYGNNSDVIQAMNLIIDRLRRYDWAAQDVNAYIDQYGSTEAQKYDYKHIHVLNATSPDAAAQEGGRSAGIVTIRYEFTVPLTDRGLKA
jgi:hypothetical protein